MKNNMPRDMKTVDNLISIEYQIKNDLSKLYNIEKSLDRKERQILFDWGNAKYKFNICGNKDSLAEELLANLDKEVVDMREKQRKHKEDIRRLHVYLNIIQGEILSVKTNESKKQDLEDDLNAGWKTV